MIEKELIAIQNSMLWAAYGDALGFITELANTENIRKRVGSNTVSKTVAWKHKIGGMWGAEIELPAGCYSDDTQLRLSTCRAIGGDGKLDIEAFAKVELPVWLAYSLGAGRGSKAAAANIIRSDVNWFSNFFDKETANYFMSGGNGAAMRIQPHVYAASDRSKFDVILKDVIRNTITTHGHARGILG